MIIKAANKPVKLQNKKNNTDKIVSIIIPAFNSTHTLKHTLPSILAQKGHFIKDIIVVDSSDDGMMPEFIKQYESDGITFINSGIKVMPAVQRNIGAKIARGDVLLFLDADVILNTDYVEKIVSSYKSGYLSGFGSVSVPSFQKYKLIPLTQYYIQLNEYIPFGENRVKLFVCGCNNYCEKKIFEQIGGYPEVRASEDVLYGYNISKYTQICFIPDATVAHIFRENWKGFADNQKLLGKYVARYRKNNMNNSLIFKGILPLILFPAFLAIKLFRMTPRILRSGRIHIIRFIIIFPLFFIGLIYWNIGFTKEALNKENR